MSMINDEKVSYQLKSKYFEEFVDGVVPVLQKRGRMQKEYQEGTLREKLFGKGPNLSKPHPAALHRQDLLALASRASQSMSKQPETASATAAK